MVTRMRFSREFEFEAIRLVKERRVAVTQAARDLDVHEKVLRKWVREASADPQHAFPGQGLITQSNQSLEMGTSPKRGIERPLSGQNRNVCSWPRLASRYVRTLTSSVRSNLSFCRSS